MHSLSSVTPPAVAVFAASILLTSLVAAGPARAVEVEDTVVLVQTGDPVPDNNGAVASLKTPVLQGGGQAAFASDISGSGILLDSAVFRVSAGGGLVQIARKGDPAPDGNGNVGSILNPSLLINAGGSIAFMNIFDNTFNGSADADVLLIGDGSGPPAIVARGGQTPSGASSPLFLLNEPAGLNAAGQVAFSGGLADGRLGTFRGDAGPGSLVTIALDGQSLPGGGTIGAGFFPGTVSPINAAGQVAFMTIQAESPFARGIYVGDGSGLIEVVRVGDPTPSGNGTIGNVGPALGAAFSNNPINDRGEVAFVAQLLNTSGGAADDQGLYLGDGSTLAELVRRGDLVPDGNGSFLDFMPVIDLDESGRVVFQSTVTGASGGATDGLFLADRSSVRQIVRRNASAPGGGVFADVLDIGGIVAQVGVVFRAFVNLDDGGSPNDDLGIFLYDGSSLRSILREGDTIPGFGVVTDFRLASGELNEGVEGNALGENGQVTYHFTSSGNFRIAVWSGLSMIFSDGFESGDTSSWAQTVP